MFGALARAFRPFRRFAKARRGSAAVEFAFVAIPFFLLSIGLVEVSMIGFAQTSLDYAVGETGRRIRLGQVQMQGVSYSEIQNDLCSQLNGFMVLDCTNALYLDVKRYPSFVSATNNSPISNGAFNSSGFGFAPGSPSDIVVVRAYYRWKVLTPLFQGVLSNVNGGERILVSTMMFRNEPYQ